MFGVKLGSSNFLKFSLDTADTHDRLLVGAWCAGNGVDVMDRLVLIWYSIDGVRYVEGFAGHKSIPKHARADDARRKLRGKLDTLKDLNHIGVNGYMIVTPNHPSLTASDTEILKADFRISATSDVC